jgi:sphingomyelin phosphodiesterase
MKALVLVLTSIFFAPVAALAQPVDIPSAPKKIKILSWNIYMLPGFLGHGKKPRAEAIGRLLASSDYDVIVFQEAFDGQARKIISRLLQPAFPFQAGPANRKTVSLKTHSGIWIFSRHPIGKVSSIRFKTRYGIDAYSRKGALLAEIRIDGEAVQIIGTHLQNAGGDWRRYSQCVELYDRLLLPAERPGVPQIVCGDFNIDRHRSSDGYQYMLQLLDATDGYNRGTQGYSYDRAINDITAEPGSQRDLIDYVLLRQPNGLMMPGERSVRVFRYPWRRGHKDLSDHFAVEAELLLPRFTGALVAVNP